MISKENTQVFGIVPWEIKRRIQRVRNIDPKWTESKLIKEGLSRILGELEGQGSPNHDGPRRKKTAA
jgi:hypothetical protein